MKTSRLRTFLFGGGPPDSWFHRLPLGWAVLVALCGVVAVLFLMWVLLVITPTPP